MAGNGWKLLEKALNVWKCSKWLDITEIDGIDWKCPEMAEKGDDSYKHNDNDGYDDDNEDLNGMALWQFWLSLGLHSIPFWF